MPRPGLATPGKLAERRRARKPAPWLWPWLLTVVSERSTLRQRRLRSRRKHRA